MAQETKMTQTTYAEQFNQFTPQVFQNPLFGNLTVLKDDNGRLWFIGVEVGRILGYTKPNDSIRSLIEEKYRMIVNLNKFCGNIPQNSSGGNPNKLIISEEGLMELINRSDLNNPTIRQFKDWANKVLVDMRQYGVSMSDQFTNAVRNYNDLNQLQNMVLDHRRALEVAQPAIHMYHQNIQNQATITAQQIADNYGWTAQRLNTILHRLGFHYPSGDGWVLYKEYKNQDLVNTITRETENGFVDFVTGYTEKGRNLIDQLLHDNYYKTKYEAQDEIDRRIQIANQKANTNNICAQPYQINNFNYFFSSNPDETWRQINSISDPNVKEDAKRAFFNHLYNQPAKDTYMDQNSNKRTKDGLFIPITDKYGNPL